MFTIINPATYLRKHIYEHFQEFEDPFFNVTANMDVTELLKKCDSTSLKFSRASMYCSLKAVNDIDVLRHRIVDGQIRDYQRIHGGTTVLREDKTYAFCYFDFLDSPEAFMDGMGDQLEIAKSEKNFEPADHRHDLIHYSSMPWVSFTQIKHARRIPILDAIPKLVFGKYFEQGGKMLLPFSIAAHHSLVDGWHVGEYFRLFQENLNEIG